jgi:hypothetical protein
MRAMMTQWCVEVKRGTPWGGRRMDRWHSPASEACSDVLVCHDRLGVVVQFAPLLGRNAPGLVLVYIDDLGGGVLFGCDPG